MTDKTCDATRQQDEMFCATCAVRWPVDEASPCPRLNPTKPRGMLERVLAALDWTPEQLAQRAQVPVREVHDAMGLSHGNMGDVEHDDLFRICADEVTRRLGLLHAARNDLDTKLHMDRAKRADRRTRTENR